LAAFLGGVRHFHRRVFDRAIFHDRLEDNAATRSAGRTDCFEDI
jgi:hypothetical protein